MVISAIVGTIFSSFSKYLNPSVNSMTNVSDSRFIEDLSIYEIVVFLILFNDLLCVQFFF
jgi:hypothetical protein